MNQEKMDLQLWNYIDGRANQEEVSFVESMIVTDAVWRNKYKELVEVNQVLKTNVELEQPSMRFSKNVMEQIVGLQPAKATVKYINKNIIRSIAAFFILTITGFLVYTFSTVEWVSTSGASPLPFDLNKLNPGQLNFSKLMSSKWINIILMVNVVLALMLLDNYLRRKKRSSVEN